jgi:7-cyano-7-deazaguanine synthase in queuosine biosynthesis
MIQTNISNINIDIHEGPIGISCSGGADSSLLLYILMKYCKDPIHVFTCVLDSKNRSTLKSASNVVSKIIDLTGNYNVYHHYHFVKEGKRIEELFKQQIQFIENKTINWLYTAITKNPPFEIQKSFSEPSRENHERHPLIERPVYMENQPIYMPFTNIDKQAIAKMYMELDILDNLFPVTRSCESITLIEGHCGECWWCEERLWGFGRLT